MSTAGGTADRLDIGGVFESTTEIYKQAFGPVWLVALIIWIPAGIISALLGSGGLLGLIGALVQAIAGVWLAGTIVKVVQDIEANGRFDASIGDLFGQVAPKLLSLLLLSILVSICVGIGLIFLIVPGVILALMWIVSTPAMVVDDLGVFDSLSRSSDLTRDNRMRILAVGILLLVAYFVISAIVVILSAEIFVIGVIAGIVLAIVVYPYIAIILAVLYFRLRELKGGGPVPEPGTGTGGGVEPPAPAV